MPDPRLTRSLDPGSKPLGRSTHWLLRSSSSASFRTPLRASCTRRWRRAEVPRAPGSQLSALVVPSPQQDGKWSPCCHKDPCIRDAAHRHWRGNGLPPGRPCARGCTGQRFLGEPGCWPRRTSTPAAAAAASAAPPCLLYDEMLIVAHLRLFGEAGPGFSASPILLPRVGQAQRPSKQPQGPSLRSFPP